MLQGDEDGSIDPDETVTRVEFMSLVNQSFGIAESVGISVNEYPKAADVAPDDPAYETVSIALARDTSEAIRKGWCIRWIR